MKNPGTDWTENGSLSLPAMAIALLLLSFSTVLFTLVIFKLLSFFIMPSLFFDLLFIGFPLGALIGTLYFKSDRTSLVKSIWILLFALLISTVAVLLAHNFDYLRAHLFNVQVSRLLMNISIFSMLFLPFFIAYGLSEYIGYQIGRKHFKARMHTVYALFLFGAAGAYFATDQLISLVGVVKLILSAFLIIVIVGLIISRSAKRLYFVILLILMGLCYTLPNLEQRFLQLYKGISPTSTMHYEHQGYSLVFQEWGKYSLNEIMAAPDSAVYLGFYNDFLQWEYYPERGYNKPSLGAIPLMLSDVNSKKLIVGSGGGRQVRFATANGHNNITAIEVEPAVIEAVRDPSNLKAEFRQVYDQPGTEIIISEGRKFLEELEEPQDLIYFPSVGGYPQMMLEPGNLIRTKESYQLTLEKLTDSGILAIWYPSGLDAKGLLTDQYVRTLRLFGAQTKAYRNNEEFLILSTLSPERQLPTAEELMKLMVTMYEQAGGTYHSFPIPLIPAQYEVSSDPNFRPVVDNKPYLGGNLSHIFSRDQIFKLYGFGAFILISLALVMYIVLKRKGDTSIPGKSFNGIALLALLLGANFLIIEHHLVLVLFKINYVFHDALMIGAIAFLILSGLGSMITTPRVRKMTIMIAVLSYLSLILFSAWIPGWATICLLTPAAIATGTFFPLLFEKAAKNPLSVFAIDAIGAGFGSLLAAAIPVLFGFQVYGYIALVVFIVTAGVDRWFHQEQTSTSSIAIDTN